MTYGRLSGDNRTFGIVVDNNTETSLFTIVDNTTALTVTGYTTFASTTADSLAIDVDGNGIPYTVIDNATGGSTLYRTNSLKCSGELSIFGPEDIK